MNNKYIIRAKHPLLRPGLSIETEASEGYVVWVLNKLLALIREFNEQEEEAKKTEEFHKALVNSLVERQTPIDEKEGDEN
jgi:hypothetical protein